MISTQLRKFYRWKYSGLIVVPGSVALILAVGFYFTSQAEFFEYWTCNTLKDYAMNVDIPDGMTPHDELSVQQHLHLHKLIKECNEYERFEIPFVHP